MKTRITLYPDEGKVLTDGKDYGEKHVTLPIGDNGENWHEITVEEYQEILKSNDENHIVE